MCIEKAEKKLEKKNRKMLKKWRNALKKRDKMDNNSIVKEKNKQNKEELNYKEVLTSLINSNNLDRVDDFFAHSSDNSVGNINYYSRNKPFFVQEELFFQI